MVQLNIASSPVLTAADFDRPFLLEVDASDVGVESVLIQANEAGLERPVCAEVNKVENDGRTALHIASQNAQNDHPDVTKYLISQGAEGNNSGKDGCTALHLAAQNGHPDVVKELISQGAEIGHPDVVKELISHGAEVNIVENRDWTALHLASRNGHLDVVKELISQGAELHRMVILTSPNILSAKEPK
eukprot:XP_011672209.1 PREDICTED: ankyrin repeat domain-containing protein 29-like [Strongylocentrotus purpuratus]